MRAPAVLKHADAGVLPTGILVGLVQEELDFRSLEAPGRFLGVAEGERLLSWLPQACGSTPSLSPFSSHSNRPSSLAATFPRICKCSAQCQPNTTTLWPSQSTPLRVLHKHPWADKTRGGKGPRFSHALAALLWPTADLVGREGWQCLVATAEISHSWKSRHRTGTGQAGASGNPRQLR